MIYLKCQNKGLNRPPNVMMLRWMKCCGMDTFGRHWGLRSRNAASIIKHSAPFGSICWPSQWSQRVYTSFHSYMVSIYGADWHTVTSWDKAAEEQSRDLVAGRDCLHRAAKATWWNWELGSRLSSGNGHLTIEG
jgi:hypothetical protein